MKLQNRLFLSVMLMGLAALIIGIVCLQASRGVFDNQAKVYNGGLAVYHLKKVSDAFAIDTIGAVQKVRSGAAWAWEDGGKVIDEAAKSAEEHWKAYMAMDKNKDEKYQASIVSALLDNNKHLMENLKNDFANKDARDLEIQATSVLYPSIDPILDNIRKLEDLNEKMGQGAVDQAEKGFTGSFNFMVGVVAVLLLAALAAGLLTANWAIRPVGALARGWESNVELVGVLAGQVASSGSHLNGSLSNAAVQLQKAGGSMEQMLSFVQQNSQETVRAKNLMDETRYSLSASGEASQRTVDTVKNLSQSAEKVFQVVKTIEEIAFQTNILALNAGVEAVRAGEQGKEFVMVVEEIRNLSQRCSQVAKETSKLVTDNVRQAAEGVRVSEETGKTIAQTSEKAGKVAGLLAVMEEGVGAQFRGMQEIRSSVNNAEREAYRNSALGEKVGSSGAALSQQAGTLRSISKQLAELVRGGLRAVRPAAKPDQPGSVTAVAPTQAVPIPSAPEKPMAPKELKVAEKTGTDGGKVVHIKNP